MPREDYNPFKRSGMRAKYERSSADEELVYVIHNGDADKDANHACRMQFR